MIKRAKKSSGYVRQSLRVGTGSSKYDDAVVARWFAEHGLNATPEYRFDPKRKWRFDFAFLEHKVALECEGGIWTAGRHTRPSGFVKDMEKYNRAAVLGWRVVRVAPDELCMQETLDMVREAIGL
jgi:very-short-patch-repair endonuclease